jgi:hypothetical protein
MASYSELFIMILRNKLLPVIDTVFKKYNDDDDPNNFLKPTNHLDTVLKNFKHGLSVLQYGFNTIYKISDFVDSGYQIIMQINATTFTISIVPFDNIQNNVTNNYFGFSPERSKKMYIYSVKANGKGPKIKGNVLNQAVFFICKSMHIPQLYISDSASVQCYWNTYISLPHFSILRVMVGKPMFYEALTGHFYNQCRALKEKQLIQESITSEEREYISRYLEDLKEKKREHTISSNDYNCSCDVLNRIIHKGLSVIDIHTAELFKYVATPYSHSQ